MDNIGSQDFHLSDSDTLSNFGGFSLLQYMI